MTAAAIPIATGQAAIPVGGGAGISPEPGRGVRANGSSASDGTAQWQQSLQQAGMKKEVSPQHSPISAAGGTEAGVTQSAGARATRNFLLHVNALAQPVPALNARSAEDHAQTAAASAGSSSGAQKAAGSLASGRKTAGRASGETVARTKDTSTAATAQSLFASLTMPAAVIAPAPPANSESRATASGALLPSSAKTSTDTAAGLLFTANSATLHAHGSTPGNVAGDALGKSGNATEVLAAEQGIAAQGTPAIHSGLTGANLNGPGAPNSLPPGTGHSALQAASASGQPQTQSAAIVGAQAAAQNAVQASSENANNLRHGLNATAQVASSHAAGAAAADAKGNSQKPSTQNASASSAHAGSGRDQAANPAQGQGSTAGNSAAVQQAGNPQAQVVSASSHAPLNGQDPRSTSGIAADSAPGAHSSDPFSSLDSGSSGVSASDFTTKSATWIHAGTHAAEAGFQDPSLGWVGVRAQVADGAIHAALLPSSSDAAQVLSGHLPGLHAYLADHHALTGTVTVARQEASAGSSGAGQGMAQSTGQGMAQDGGQGSRQGGGAPMYSASSGGQTDVSPQAGVSVLAGIHGLGGAAAVSHTSQLFAPLGGGIISVVA